MRIILLLFITFIFLSSFAYAYPSDETIRCLSERIIRDCKDMLIVKCNESGTCFRNETISDKKTLEEYISSWTKDWENQAILVQSSYTPLVCTKEFIRQDHSFMVDSNYYPLWDNQQFSCPQGYNLTIIGISLISEGGLTLIGLSLFGIGGLTIFGALYILFKHKSNNK